MSAFKVSCGPFPHADFPCSVQLSRRRKTRKLRPDKLSWPTKSTEGPAELRKMGGEEASGREERERDRDRERDTESRERLKRHPSVFHSRAEEKERTAREGSTTEEDQQSSFLSSPAFHLSVFLNGKRKDREKKGKEAETKAESLALPIQRSSTNKRSRTRVVFF